MLARSFPIRCRCELLLRVDDPVEDHKQYFGQALTNVFMASDQSQRGFLTRAEFRTTRLGLQAAVRACMVARVAGEEAARSRAGMALASRKAQGSFHQMPDERVAPALRVGSCLV